MSDQLAVMESFYTVQGEGYHSGRAAYFIRLAGCDVGCVWCDVKESWEIQQDQYQSISDICQEVAASETDFVVITGGEPCMYDLTDLCDELHQLGVEIAVETSGAYPIKGSFDWICLSPKKFKPTLEENYGKAHELKVVIFHPHDFEWSNEHKAKVGPNCKLYLQPEWDKSEKMLPLIIDHVKTNKAWNISLQTHKFMDIP